MSLKWQRTVLFTGGIITLGFGIWHFFVPTLYGWMDYMASLPTELINGISATNFFLGFSLSLLGAVTVASTVWLWDNRKTIVLLAWSMVVLWAARAVYQALNPQGQMIPGLAVTMLIIFAVTGLCFLVPAINLTRNHASQH